MPHYSRPYSRDIVHRWEGNPLITVSDLSFKCLDIRDAGATYYGDEVVLLVTIQHLSGCQYIHLARQAKNNRFFVEEKPFISPSGDPVTQDHESMGVLDPRIVYMEKAYYIMYLADGDHGYRLGLVKTKDFTHVERIGLISEPDMKAGTLFPKKIRKRYARLERPAEGNGIWISYSEDLIYWGDSRFLFSPRGGYWDTSRIGIGPPPVELDIGWLLLYYGAKDTSAGPLYRLGAAIVDKKDPTILLGRSNWPVLAPREMYERVGNTPNIIFSTGALVKDNKTLVIYYGAADSCINVGTVEIKEIINSCINEEREF